MSLLANYNPIKTLWLPGVELAEPKGIVVVVGPNSSGKTLFLRDIERYLLKGIPEFVVCEGIAPRRPNAFQEFFNELLAHHYLQPMPNDTNNFRTYVPYMTPQDKNEPNRGQPFQSKLLEKAFNEMSEERGSNAAGWFGPIGVTLVAPLTLDERRKVGNKTQSFDYRAGSPAVPVQGLYVNSDAQEKLAEETGNVFGNAVWLDISENGVLQLRVSGSKSRPPQGEMINPLQAHKYSAIENEGDGYRSYVGICLSLLLATRPVALIDEPELCLHPPQAYHIGRFIGRYATNNHVAFIATHSSHVLRGILDTGENVKVVRLTRRGKQFRSTLVGEELVKTVRNPRTRAETILDGIFSKGVVLVESEGDREEYQAAAEALDDYPAREVHFAPVGGTGGFAEPLRFYRMLNIPTAVIIDLDAICDVDKVVLISEALAGNLDAVRESVTKLRALAQQIKSLPPPITEAEVKTLLGELSAESWNWSGGGDNLLRRKLGELDDQLKRIQRLKDGGVEAYQDRPDIVEQLFDVIARFSNIGLFFVPVGELEDWVKELMKDTPKGSKSKTDRAALAADRIRTSPEKSGDIREFVRKVLDHLQDVLNGHSPTATA